MHWKKIHTEGPSQGLNQDSLGCDARVLITTPLSSPMFLSLVIFIAFFTPNVFIQSCSIQLHFICTAQYHKTNSLVGRHTGNCTKAESWT